MEFCHADEVQQGERIAVEYADASAGYRHRSGLLQCDKVLSAALGSKAGKLRTDYRKIIPELNGGMPKS